MNFFNDYLSAFLSAACVAHVYLCVLASINVFRKDRREEQLPVKKTSAPLVQEGEPTIAVRPRGKTRKKRVR